MKARYYQVIKSLVEDVALHVYPAVATEETDTHLPNFWLRFADLTAVTSWEGIVCNLRLDVVIEVNLFPTELRVLTDDVCMHTGIYDLLLQIDVHAQKFFVVDYLAQFTLNRPYQND